MCWYTFAASCSSVRLGSPLYIPFRFKYGHTCPGVAMPVAKPGIEVRSVKLNEILCPVNVVILEL